MFALLANQIKPVWHCYTGRKCVIKDNFTGTGVTSITGKTTSRQECTCQFNYLPSTQSKTISRRPRVQIV